MSKRTKMLATLGLVIVIIGGVIFAWINLSGKTEQAVTPDTAIEQVVEETEVAEEEEKTEFTWKEKASTAKEEMIVVKDTKIYSKPTRDYDSQVLGDLALDQIGTNLASCLSDEGVDLMWNKVDFNGVVGYVDILDVNFNVSLEDDWLANEPIEEAQEVESGVSSETESIIEVNEEKTEEKPVEEVKVEEPAKVEEKKEETPAPAPQPAPQPQQEQPKTGIVDGVNYDVLNSRGTLEETTTVGTVGNETWSGSGITVE